MKCKLFAALCAAVSIMSLPVMADDLEAYGKEYFDDYTVGELIKGKTGNADTGIGDWTSGESDQSTVQGESDPYLSLDTEGDVLSLSLKNAEQIGTDFNEDTSIIFSSKVQFVPSDELEEFDPAEHGSMKYAIYALEQEFVREEIVDNPAYTAAEDPIGIDQYITNQIPYVVTNLVVYHSYQKSGEGIAYTNDIVNSSEVIENALKDALTLDVEMKCVSSVSYPLYKFSIGEEVLTAPYAMTDDELVDGVWTGTGDGARVWFQGITETTTALTAMSFSGTGTIDTLSVGNRVNSANVEYFELSINNTLSEEEYVLLDLNTSDILNTSSTFKYDATEGAINTVDFACFKLDPTYDPSDDAASPYISDNEGNPVSYEVVFDPAGQFTRVAADAVLMMGYEYYTCDLSKLTKSDVTVTISMEGDEGDGGTTEPETPVKPNSIKVTGATATTDEATGVVTVTVEEGRKLITILADGEVVNYTAGDNNTYTFTAAGQDVIVSTEKDRSTLTIANKWYENPVVKAVTDPAIASSNPNFGMYLAGMSGDYFGAIGYLCQDAKIYDIYDLIAADDATVKSAASSDVLPAGSAGIAISPALNVALVGNYSTTTAYAIPLNATATTENSYAITTDNGVGLTDMEFTKDGQYLYAISATKVDTAESGRKTVFKYAVKNGLKTAGANLELVAFYELGDRARGMDLVTVGNTDYVFVIGGEETAFVKVINTVTEDVIDLTEAMALREKEVFSEIQVSGVKAGEMHLVVSTATATMEAEELRVYDLTIGETISVGADPFTLNAAKLRNMGLPTQRAEIDPDHDRYSFTALSTDDEGTLYLGWIDRKIYAIEYAAPQEVTVDVTKGSAKPAANFGKVTFKSYDEKTIVFTPTTGYELGTVTINGADVTSSYTPDADGNVTVTVAADTTSVDVVFVQAVATPTFSVAGAGEFHLVYADMVMEGTTSAPWNYTQEVMVGLSMGIKAAEGSEITGVTIGGTAVDGWTAEQYTVTIAKEHNGKTIEVTLAKKTYAVTWAVSGPEGAAVTAKVGETVVASGDTIAHGSVITFSVAEGYTIKSVGEDTEAPFEYTVIAAGAIAIVVEAKAAEGFVEGNEVGGITITADQATWLNGLVAAGDATADAIKSGDSDEISLEQEYLLGLNPAVNSEYTFNVKSITVGNKVDIVVALTRKNGADTVTTAINGTLELWGTADLGTEYTKVAAAEFTDGTFAGKTEATTSFNVGDMKFFKAIIK